MKSYIQVVKELPLPTELQTREFAEFVAGSKRWRRLPAFETTEFVFYLDPNAGRPMVHTEEFGATFVDQDEYARFYFEWQSTVRCRERFGYWNYDSPYSETYGCRTTNGLADTAGPGRLIPTPEGKWVGASDPYGRSIILERTVKGVVDMPGPGLIVHSAGESIGISEPYGRSMLKRPDGHLVDTAGLGLCVQSPEGEWVDVPEPLVRAGTAQVSSLLYRDDLVGHFDQRTRRDHVLRRYEQRLDEQRLGILLHGSVAFGGRHVCTAKLSHMVNKISELHPETGIGASLLPLMTLWTSEAYRRERDDVSREVDALKNKAGATSGTANLWEKTESRRRELELIPLVIAALDRERERQIECMVAAMQCYLAASQPPSVLD